LTYSGGNKAQLLDYLGTLGVTETDLSELDSAIDEEGSLRDEDHGKDCKGDDRN
jgi:hypothetical protein